MLYRTDKSTRRNSFPSGYAGLSHPLSTYLLLCVVKDFSKKVIVPKTLISNSLGLNSLVAETIRMNLSEKFRLHRQENYWKQTHGLDISRDNNTNWHIKAVQNALDPLEND